MEKLKMVYSYYIGGVTEGLAELVTVTLVLGTVLFFVGKPEILAGHNILFGGPILLAWIVITTAFSLVSGWCFGGLTQLINLALMLGVGFATYPLVCGIAWVGRKTKMNQASRATAVVEDD